MKLKVYASCGLKGMDVQDIATCEKLLNDYLFSRHWQVQFISGRFVGFNHINGKSTDDLGIMIRSKNGRWQLCREDR